MRESLHCVIVGLRVKRLASGWGGSTSTVARTLAEVGWQRLKALEPKPEARRYERRWAGELLESDTE